MLFNLRHAPKGDQPQVTLADVQCSRATRSFHVGSAESSEGTMSGGTLTLWEGAEIMTLR